MNNTQSFVGTDVSKAELDIYVRPSSTSWTVPNDAEGHTQSRSDSVCESAPVYDTVSLE